MTKLSVNTELLRQRPFLDDEVSFNLIYMIIGSETAVFAASANNRAIIAQNPSFPAWIWTDAAITKPEIEELAMDFNSLYQENDRLELIAKPEIARYLANDYAKRNQVSFRKLFDMESYRCPKVISPETVKGETHLPTLEDAELIARFLAGFMVDCFARETTLESQTKKAQGFIEKGSCFTWKAGDDIVAMAAVHHCAPRHARISCVYTPLKHRKNGFASALVAALSQNILDEGLIPVLYTDLANPHSNKIYQSIGFEKCGSLSHFSFEMV